MKFIASKRKNIMRIIMILVLIFVVANFSFSASAYYYLTGNALYLQFTPHVYSMDQVILAIGEDEDDSLVTPEDIYIDANDNIFIADTGKRRILAFDSEMNFVQSVPNSKNKDPKAELANPKGVFVSKVGNFFVADTDNERVVHYDSEGMYIEEFTMPDDPTFNSETGFKPTKVFIDDYGVIYTINEMDYNGITTLAPNGDFMGYIGQIKVPFNLTTYLVRLFASEQIEEEVGQDMPPHYSNIASNGDSTIYATSLHEKTQQIKRLTQSGTNVYLNKQYGEGLSSDNEDGYDLPEFAAIAVNEQGIIYAADRLTNQIYIYDQAGNNLSIIGGTGIYKGTFTLISGVAIDSKGKLYVVDRNTGAVQILTPTDFMTNILEAITLYNNGDYDKAMVPWREVLAMDPSYMWAEVGYAKSLLNNGNNMEALARYADAFDQLGYSDAYEVIRSDFFKDNFFLVAGIIVALLVGFLLLASKLGKLAKKISNRRNVLPENDKFGAKFFLETLLLMIYHPIDAFNNIKRNRKQVTIWSLIAMFVMIVAQRIIYWQFIHFPLSARPIYINYTRELAVFLVPLASWIVVSYAMTSIAEGKQTFKETIAANLYSFTPFMVFYLPITLLTQVMTFHDFGLYDFLMVCVFTWCMLLIFTNLKIQNEYVFKKAVFNVFKIIFAIICLWMIIFLFFVITEQLFSFVGDIFKESTFINR